MEELELTYLAKYLPKDLEKFLSKEILDIYIPESSNHPTIRIRKSGAKYEITKKEPINAHDLSRQLEQTIPLTEAEYKDFEKLCGKRLSKRRYFYKTHNTAHEIDVFTGDLAGLVVVDVEFSTEAEKASFAMPDFCLVDVTQEKFIAGGMLCGKTYKDIEPNLEKFGYKKI
ncbi:MAG TPA: hypothetical protein VI981_00505 [Candidatus Paceibacterota bacterium]